VEGDLYVRCWSTLFNRKILPHKYQPLGVTQKGTVVYRGNVAIKCRSGVLSLVNNAEHWYEGEMLSNSGCDSSGNQKDNFDYRSSVFTSKNDVVALLYFQPLQIWELNRAK